MILVIDRQILLSLLKIPTAREAREIGLAFLGVGC
jgi:hypothetical protein